MPQLDLATFAPQLVWLAITFIVLYLLMSQVALPQVGRAIDQRGEKIEGDLAQARRMQTEAEATLAAYERRLAEARAEAQAVMRAATERLNAEAAQRQEAAAARIAAETGAAEQRIAEARAAALANVRTVAIDVAESAAAKLIGTAPADEAAGSAVDAVLKERA
jgi:F-type H+-transporting ATPase subunit b